MRIFPTILFTFSVFVVALFSCANPAEAPLGGVVKYVSAVAYCDNPGPTEVPILFQVWIIGKDPSLAPSFISVDYPGNPSNQPKLYYSAYDDGYGFVVADYEGFYPTVGQTSNECTVHITTSTDQFDKTIPIQIEGWNPPPPK